MRDINFFDAYMPKGKWKKSQKHIIFMLLICIILILIPLVNQYIIYIKKQNITAAMNMVNSSEKFKIMEIKKKKLKLEEMKNYYEMLEQVQLAINNKDFIDDSCIRTLMDILPNDLYLSKFRALGNKVEINGFAKDKASIAKFESRLRQMIFFENIFVPSISKLNNSYSFSLTFTFKDVS